MVRSTLQATFHPFTQPLSNRIVHKLSLSLPLIPYFIRQYLRAHSSNTLKSCQLVFHHSISIALLRRDASASLGRGPITARLLTLYNTQDLGIMTVSSKPDWLSTLEKDGFVVVPGLVSAEDCAAFREQALQWLESFPHGFNRDDKSTWTLENLPYGIT